MNRAEKELELATILATWRDGAAEAWAIDMYIEPAQAILNAGYDKP